MNEVSPPGLDSAEAPTPFEAAPAPGFGAALAQAREAQGISVADMATRLRLHPRQVTALEAERLEALPEAPFVRGFLRNYAKEVHLDPAPLLAALNAKLPSSAASAETLADSGISAGEVRRAGMEHTSRIAVIGGTVALLLVLGLIGWLASNRVTAPNLAGTQAPAALPAGGSDRPAPASETSLAPAPVASAAVPAAAERPGPAAESKDIAVPGAAPAPSATSAATAATGAVAASPSPATAGSGGLRLVVGERPSWVEITQADGRVILTGLLEPGSERRLGNPQPPLQLVIGNASTVTLEYRGRPVDLQRHVRANDLARLSLE